MAKAIDEQRGKPGALRRGLMLYGSSAALAAGLMLAEGGVGPALAQEIGPRVTPSVAAQGDFTVPGPTPAPSFDFRSGSLDIVSMNRDAVLNWTTYDGAPPGGSQGNSYVNFLPAGTELRFVGNGQNFTAINRVFTAPDNAGNYRGIAIQGQVTSYLSGDGPNSVGPIGGNIWFYSPGGILATGSAVFNVGSLVLSASDFDNFFEFGSARSVDLTGVANPFAAVILNPGARVTLTQPSSSFAIVAPTIVQGGEVTVDGSVLYMSAERGFLYFYNNGQVFGSVNQGAQAGNEIRHTGTTTGPASLTTDDFSVFDPHTIEFRTGQDVRVLLSGSIGYAPATDAALGPNGTIVLSAGAVASVGDLNLTSYTTLEAADVNLSVGAGDSIAMGGDVNGAYGLDVITSDATVTVGAGGAVDIAGDVLFRSANQAGSFRIAVEAAQGNNPGGRIDVGGNLLLVSSFADFGGNAQQGGDIEVTIGDGGSIAVGGDMTLRSDGFAADNDGDPTFAAGGRAVLAMTGPSANLEVGEVLTLSAQARPFSGNCECFPPSSGSAEGGYAALTATGGTIELGTLSISASAEAFSSFYTDNGANLEATGGTALANLGDSFATIGYASIAADATAASASSGANGGAAFGGDAGFAKGGGGSLAIGGLVVSAQAQGGRGSESSESSTIGRGGDATGGTASVSFARSPDGLGYLELNAEARGGAGGDGAGTSGAAGERGGDAFGGSVALTVTGEGTVLADLPEGALRAGAFGGEGGDGERDFNLGVASGAGGAGGLARGGALTVTAADGATYHSQLPMDVDGYGGAGGSGGDAVFGEGGVGDPGPGGLGGDGQGGALALIADGGAITGTLELAARGIGGEGGLDGFTGDNFPGAGPSGSTTGGSIALTATAAGTSLFDVDSAELDTSGDVAGTIAIADETTGAEAGMRFGSLFAESSGSPTGPTPAVRVSAVGNAIGVDGTAQIDAHSIALVFSGTGRMEVGGFTLLSTDGGDVTVTHAGNPGVRSLDSGGPLEIYSGGDLIAGPGSVLASAAYANLRALGSIDVADVRSGGATTISAQGDVTLADASAGGDFNLFAGRLEFDGGHGYLSSARATITGLVTVGGSALVEAGGFAEFAGGSELLSDNDLTVRTGDDIVVASGARLVSDINPFDDSETMRLLAGDIDFGPESGDLVESIATPIASLLVGGSLETNGASLYLSGDAIDATGSSIATGALFVDVTDAPPFGPYSNDGGALSVECRQSNACLGSVAATTSVAIGLNSNGGLVALRMGAIDFTGATFDVRTLEGLAIGAAGTPSLIGATARVSLENATGPVSLTDVTVNSPAIAIRAGGELAAASSSLISSGDILLEIGGDIAAGTIDTARKLDDGSGAPVFTASGDFNVRSLSYGNGNAIRIDGAGDIAVTFADPRAADIEMAARGDLYLGSSAPTTGTIRLDGTAVAFDNLVAMGAGALRASGAIAGGDIAVGGTLSLQADSMALGRAQAGDGISAATAGAASFTELASAGGAIALDAGGAVTGGVARAAGSVTLAGTAVALADASFGNGLSLTARSGSLTGSGLYRGAGAAILQAAQGIAIGSLDTLGAITMTAAREARFVELRSRDGAVSVSAGGDIVGSSVAATGSDPAGDDSISLTAGGAITLDGTATALNPASRAQDDFTARAGGALAIVRGEAGRDLSFTAGAGTLSAADVASGRDVSLTGPTVRLADGSVARNLTVWATAGDITGGGATIAGGAVALDASGNIAIGSLSADGGNLSATAGGIIGFAELSSAGAIALLAPGAVTGTALQAANGITAAGASLALGTAAGGAGDVALDARQGALAVNTISGANVTAAATGALALGTVTATRSVSLSGASAEFASVTAGTGVAMSSGGTIEGGTVAAGGLAAVFAADAITLTGLSAVNAEIESQRGAVSASGIAVTGRLEASGAALSLAATGALQVDAEATAGAIGITATGDLTVNAAAPGDIALASSGGSVIIGRVEQLGSAPGGLSTQSVSGGGAVAVTAAGGITVLDSLTAGGALTMTAGGLVSLAGPATGQTIALQSGDLTIGSGGALGGPNTQRIALSSSSPVNLGSEAVGGFAVDAAEFARIQSGGDLLVTALAGTGPGAGSLTVGSLTVNTGSGGQIGAAATFGLTASTVLDVNAALSVARAGAGTTLLLTGDAIDLDYANAAVSVLDGASAATGRIVANARLITSLSAGATADIAGKTPQAVDLRLGQADSVREIALFRAGSLTLQGRDAILIQNSGGGSADERRGVTVGALTVTGAADGRTLVVINGIVNAATGNVAAQNVTVTTAIDAGSTVNGCALANIPGCFFVPEPPPLITAPESVLFGTSDFIKDEANDDEVEDGVADGKTDAPPIDTTQIDDPAGLPMIDEPVTGAGNEDLWQRPEQ